VVDVHARASLIKKTTEVVLVRGRRRRRVHWKGWTSPSRAPAASPSPGSHPPSRLVRGASVLPFINSTPIDIKANQVPYPQLPTTLQPVQALPTDSIMDHQASPIPIASSSNGRISGKPWKHSKSPTVCVLHPVSMALIVMLFHVSRSHLQPAVKSSFHDRMEKTTKAQAIKKLQAELKEERQAEIQR
jgi:hypothetical protein